VFAAVERNGRIHHRVVADVTGDTLRDAIREVVDTEALSLLMRILPTEVLDVSTQVMTAFARQEVICAKRCKHEYGGDLFRVG
jgi:hypothetical protein